MGVRGVAYGDRPNRFVVLLEDGLAHVVSTYFTRDQFLGYIMEGQTRSPNCQGPWIRVSALLDDDAPVSCIGCLATRVP